MTDNNKVNENQANFYQTIPGSHCWDNFGMLLNWARYKKSANEPIDHDYLIKGLENSYNRQPEIELEEDNQLSKIKLSLKPIIENMRKSYEAWGVGAFLSFADEIENLINKSGE